MNEDNCLDGDEIMVIIQALEIAISVPIAASTWTNVGGHLGYFARAYGTWLACTTTTMRHWRQQQMRKEREATVEELHRMLARLLEEPNLTRRTFKQGMISALIEVRDTEQYKRPPLGGWLKGPYRRR